MPLTVIIQLVFYDIRIYNVHICYISISVHSKSVEEITYTFHWIPSEELTALCFFLVQLEYFVGFLNEVRIGSNDMYSTSVESIKSLLYLITELGDLLLLW